MEITRAKNCHVSEKNRRSNRIEARSGDVDVHIPKIILSPIYLFSAFFFVLRRGSQSVLVVGVLLS